MKAKEKDGEFVLKLACLKLLKATDAVIRQTEHLREHRDEFLKTVALESTGQAKNGQGVSHE